MPLVTLAILAGVVLGALVLILGGNFTLELAEGDSPREAWVDTRMLAVGLGGAVVGVVASGLVTVGQAVDAFAGLLGMSPVAFTNMTSIGLGALGLSGALNITPRLYVAVTVGFLGLALLVTEVKK